MINASLQKIRNAAVELIEKHCAPDCICLQIVINVHPEKNRVQISFTQNMKEKSLLK